jgi:hypothetical protein
MCLKHILFGCTPPNRYPSPHPQNNFSRFHSSIFIYGYKIQPPYPSLSPVSLFPPFYGLPTLEKIYFFLLPFILKIRCILIVQGCFTLVLQRSVDIMFLSNYPPSPLLLTLSLSPCSPHIQQLTVQCIILYSYIDGLFQYFSFSNIFFLSSISQNSLRQTNTILFFLSLSIYIYTHIYDHIHFYIYI